VEEHWRRGAHVVNSTVQALTLFVSSSFIYLVLSLPVIISKLQYISVALIATCKPLISFIIDISVSVCQLQHVVLSSSLLSLNLRVFKLFSEIYVVCAARMT